MEKTERKKSEDSDQKERGFFSINSVGELLPFIFVIFFFAFILGSQVELDSQAYNRTQTTAIMSETAYAEQENNERNLEELEEEIHINKSPVVSDAKTLPIIRNKNMKQKKVEKIEAYPRPHFPKAETREELPKLEISQPVEVLSPTSEKYSKVEIEESAEIIVSQKTIKKSITPTIVSHEKEQLVKTLEVKSIKKLVEVKIETAEMIVESNWKAKEIEEEIIEEQAIEIRSAEPNQTKSVETTIQYNSSDFKWTLNNYNHGLKKSAKFINTPDGKAAYCHTDAGIVLKVNELSNIDPDFGIFVEKSEDGKEYTSVGIINAENENGLYYFDAEHSSDGQHHYRFRTSNKAGDKLEFGAVSVIRRGSMAPISSQVNASGKYHLILESKLSQAVKFEIKEAWGSLNGAKGTQQLVAGENALSFDLTGDPGLYFLTLTSEKQNLELLIEKPGISPDLSFYEQEVSGKQSFMDEPSVPFLLTQENKLIFDFYLKNGNTLIFNEGEYNSETVKIKKARIEQLPASLQGRHSDKMLWFTASSNISYLHQKVPVILEHNNQEIAAQINIFASKNAIRPISHFSPDGDGIQDEWKIPGIKSCPSTNLMVFNDWGNLVYNTKNVTEKNIWKGEKNGEKLPAGMYYYVLGQYGGWVHLDR